MSRQHVARTGRIAVFIFALSGIAFAISRVIVTLSGRTAPAGQFGSNYAGQSLPVLVHVLPAVVFMLLGPVQFIAPLRRRYPRVHRWSGRVFLAAAAIIGLSALYLGVRVPFGGVLESAATVVFGAAFLYSLGRAFVCILRRQVRQHREWMIRGFSLGLGVISIRLATIPFVIVARGRLTSEALGIAFWIGFVSTLLVAEWWVRATRRPPRPRRPVARAVAGAQNIPPPFDPAGQG